MGRVKYFVYFCSIGNIFIDKVKKYGFRELCISLRHGLSSLLYRSGDLPAPCINCIINNPSQFKFSWEGSGGSSFTKEDPPAIFSIIPHYLAGPLFCTPQMPSRITARAMPAPREKGSPSSATPASTDRTVVRLLRETTLAMGALATA